MSKVGLPENLKNLRLSYGYTQEEISTRLNIERQTYGHYENGKRTPSLEIIIGLADFYQITLDDLIRKNTAQAVHEDTTYHVSKEDLHNHKMLLSTKESRLIKDLRIFTLSDRKEILNYVDYKKNNLKKYQL